MIEYILLIAVPGFLIFTVFSWRYLVFKKKCRNQESNESGSYFQNNEYEYENVRYQPDRSMKASEEATGV